ncbi:PREDICTED: protein unc-93 homolog B1 [Cyprinodon variegatus]|uniref:protein unc-93 homolog B1 n=1 Tax=Cyprinodon variegatus TaxID=28743 RepID=UPI000742575C|nr:PREDICTED: protein unc-93 homolog B1 [Cyprinodon variegatus]
MEGTEEDQLIEEAEHIVAPPNGGVNELHDVGQEDNMQGEMEEFLGPQAQYNEEEEERKYYRRKRLGVIKNVVASSIGAMIVYSVYMGQMAQQYYEYANYKEEHVQEQRKLPKGACHSYVIVFQSVFFFIFSLSFVFAEFPMRLVLHDHLHENPHILFNVKTCGAAIRGIIPGFNSTVLTNLPRSMLLIEVESILMGFAFLSMIIFLLLCGPAYRPTEEIDLRSIGWGNIFQLPFKHLRDYRLRLLCPFFIYSGLEMLFVISGFSLSYGVCILGLKSLWILIVVYGLSCSVFSLLSLSLLRLPRWVCLMGGAVVHGILLVVLLALSVKPNSPEYLGPLLVIMVLWGLGSALNKAGVSTVIGILYAEEKERLDFVYTIYHWWQAIAIFVVYLWSQMPMRAKLSILLATLLLACYCYWVMERRVAQKVQHRMPRIPRPRHKVKGYRYLEEDNSDESDSDRSEKDDEEEEGERAEEDDHVVEEMGAGDREEEGQDARAEGADSPGAQRREAEGQGVHVEEEGREM